MSDQNEIVEIEDTVSEAQESANRLRRQIVKAGAVAVPTIISLQSGTAWAISSCASRGVTEPTVGTVTTEFGLSSDPPSAAQQGNRDLVTAVTGIPDVDIDTIVTSFAGTNSGMNYPEGPATVEDGDIIHLLVTNGSCWTSFCASSISAPRDECAI